MSTFEEIFLNTGMTPTAAAERLAETLDMELHRDAAGRVYVGRPVAGDSGTRVGGEVHTNGYADPDPAPDEVSLLDGYDTVYAVWSTNPEIQQAEAARIFSEITNRLPWPALLTHDANDLHASWTPELGRRDFDPPVSPDAQDRAAWSEYELPTASP